MTDVIHHGPPQDWDQRCEDFNTKPNVIYHAHDLPRCLETAIVGWGNPPRWLCQTHYEKRLDESRKAVIKAATTLFPNRGRN